MYACGSRRRHLLICTRAAGRMSPASPPLGLCPHAHYCAPPQPPAQSARQALDGAGRGGPAAGHPRRIPLPAQLLQPGPEAGASPARRTKRRPARPSSSTAPHRRNQALAAVMSEAPGTTTSAMILALPGELLEGVARCLDRRGDVCSLRLACSGLRGPATLAVRRARRWRAARRGVGRVPCRTDLVINPYTAASSILRPRLLALLPGLPERARASASTTAMPSRIATPSCCSCCQRPSTSACSSSRPAACCWRRRASCWQACRGCSAASCTCTALGLLAQCC